MLKRVFILLIVITIIFGCAKKSTEFKKVSVLNLVAQIPIVGNPLDMGFTDSDVYIAEDQGGVSRISLDNYTKDWFTAFYADGANTVDLVKIRKLAVLPDQDLLFVYDLNGSDGIKIVDTTDPDSLRITGAIIGGVTSLNDFSFKQISISDTLLGYEALFASGMSVKLGKYTFHEVGLPPLFAITLTINIPSDANGAFSAGDYIYVAAEQRGLLIYNRTTGALVGEVDLPGEAQKIKVMGNYAYLTCRQDGLQIVDVTNPASPVRVGSFDTTGYATNLDVWENHVVVSSGGGGIYVFNVSNPRIPVLKENVTNCGYVNSVSYNQNKVFVASRDKGILVYNIVQ